MVTKNREYPYYCFKGDETEKFLEGRYWNTNGKGICIIAVVTEGIDWAAYVGADNGYREQDCLLWTSERGQKLSEKDARYFFPDIKLPYRS
jgi:hypothetical protein